MPGDVIEVSPARPPENVTWVGGDSDCDHTNADQVSMHGICRDCGASTLETLEMPDSLVTDKPDPYPGQMERV